MGIVDKKYKKIKEQYFIKQNEKKILELLQEGYEFKDMEEIKIQDNSNYRWVFTNVEYKKGGKPLTEYIPMSNEEIIENVIVRNIKPVEQIGLGIKKKRSAKKPVKKRSAKKPVKKRSAKKSTKKSAKKSVKKSAKRRSYKKRSSKKSAKKSAKKSVKRRLYKKISSKKTTQKSVKKISSKKTTQKKSVKRRSNKKASNKSKK